MRRAVHLYLRWSPTVVDASVAVLLLLAWTGPAWAGPRLVRELYLLTIVEGLSLLVLLAVPAARRRGVTLLERGRLWLWVAFVLAFVAGLAFRAGIAWPLLALARVTWTAMVLTDRPGTLSPVDLRLAYAGLTALPWLALAAFVPWPTGGLTPVVVEQALAPLGWTETAAYMRGHWAFFTLYFSGAAVWGAFLSAGRVHLRFGRA